MFNFFRRTFQSAYERIAALCSRNTVDEQTLTELEAVLLESDVGMPTTRSIIETLRSKAQASGNNELPLSSALEETILAILNDGAQHNSCSNARVQLLVGINGSGKTTTAGKLAYRHAQQGKRVLLVAADTFRAAAVEQLKAVAQNCNVAIEEGKPGQDPASVVFAGCEQLAHGAYDHLIIDTAGRLHTSINLMHELAKIRRVIEKKLPNESIDTLLTIDAVLGQNSLTQARLFKEHAHVTHTVLTKMDSSAKGGVVLAIVQELHIPVLYISHGEKMSDLELFNPQDYVRGLLDSTVHDQTQKAVT